MYRLDNRLRHLHRLPPVGARDGRSPLLAHSACEFLDQGRQVGLPLPHLYGLRRPTTELQIHVVLVVGVGGAGRTATGVRD